MSLKEQLTGIGMVALAVLASCGLILSQPADPVIYSSALLLTLAMFLPAEIEDASA